MTIRSNQSPQRIWLKFATAVLAGLGIAGSVSAAEPVVPHHVKKPVVLEPTKPIDIKPLDLKKVNPKLVLPGKQVKPADPNAVNPKDFLPQDLVQKLQPKKPGLPKELMPKDLGFKPAPKAKPAGPKDLVAKPTPKFPGPGDKKPGDLKPLDEDDGNGGNGNGGNGNNNGNNNDPNWLQWLAYLAWLNQQGHNHHHDHYDDLQPPVIIVPEAPQIVVPLPDQQQAKRFEVPMGADLPLGGANFGMQTGYAILQMGDLTVSLETPAWAASSIVVRLPELKLLSAANADLHLYDVEGEYLTTVALKLTPAQ
jgi:hypothetical protein